MVAEQLLADLARTALASFAAGNEPRLSVMVVAHDHIEQKLDKLRGLVRRLGGLPRATQPSDPP